MDDDRIIWAGAVRAIRVTVTTSSDVSAWTVVWRLGTEPGTAAVLEKTLTMADAELKLFTGTITAAQSAALDAGDYVVFVVRTDSGSEDYLGQDQFEVRAMVGAAA